MGLLDSILGTLAGGASRGQGGSPGGDVLMQALMALLAQSGAQGGAQAGAPGGGLGGLGGLAQQFERGGLGDLMASWIGTGQNLPVSGRQLEGVFGSDAIGQFAQQLGLSQGEAADQLSQLLPQVVDRMTPEGRLPEGGGFDDVGAILRGFQR